MRPSKYSCTTFAKGHRASQGSNAGLRLTQKELNGRTEQVTLSPLLRSRILQSPSAQLSSQLLYHHPLPRTPQKPFWGHMPCIATPVHHSLPALATGPCCLLGSPSNETSCGASLSTSGLSSLGLSHWGRGQPAGSSQGLWHPCVVWAGRGGDGISLHGPHSGPAPSSTLGALALAILPFSWAPDYLPTGTKKEAES